MSSGVSTAPATEPRSSLTLASTPALTDTAAHTIPRVRAPVRDPAPTSPARPGRSTILPVAAADAAPTVLIMAAGEGTRMRSSLPKVLHPVCGRPMIGWPVLAARDAGAGRIVVIVSPDRDLTPGLPDGTETVVQPEADGTGGAMRAAIDVIRASDEVVVLSGHHPLVTADTIAELLETHRSAEALATVMTVEMDDPGSYGRIVRDDAGDIERI